MADRIEGRIRWVLPDDPGPGVGRPSPVAHNHVWEMTVAGKQRTCRQEFVLDAGGTLNEARCDPIDQEFVKAAARYFGGEGHEVLTFRLEDRILFDLITPRPLHDEESGELVVRGEATHRLSDDEAVRDCVEERVLARFAWVPARNAAPPSPSKC